MKKKDDTRSYGSNTQDRPTEQETSPPEIPGKEKILPPGHSLPDGFVLTDEFKDAYGLMENTKKCLFISGRAGTGKSTLVTYFRINSKKNVVYLAPTGVAALNVQGTTIHSFFKFPHHFIEIANIKPNYMRQEIFEKLDTIVIDEISMARADIVDGIDASLRINRKNPAPFGGVQMIFIGDLYQLPPVVGSKETVKNVESGDREIKIPLKQHFETQYGGVYFFNSKAFNSLQFENIELTYIFRQKDRRFIDLLNAFRQQNFKRADLEVLNRQYKPYDDNVSNEVVLTICTTNAIAGIINEKNMNNLPSKPYIYEAVIDGKYDTELFPTERNLILKAGAQIMMLKNSPSHFWFNGSLGIVKNLSEENIHVEIKGITYPIKKETWESVEYEYNQETKKIEAKVIGTFTQYPLKAAWAVTIHKSQGQTFDRVAIDLGNGAFAHGQTYVALSRCTSLEGITLRRPVEYKDIILDPKVVGFMKKIQPPEDILF
ncbi:MAG: AAA family ATPase [Treponema sp.]|nr:AAA family ATPase [Treponema sp.]